MGLAPDVSEPAVQNYPLTLHGVANQHLSWETRIGVGRLSLHAVECTTANIQTPECAMTVNQPGGTCDACVNLKFTGQYRGMVQQAAQPGKHDNVKNLYFPMLTPQQIQDRSNKWKRKHRTLRMKILNLLRKVTNLHRRVALQKHILIYLADNEVSGSKRVLSQALREGLSPKAMLHRLEQMFQGK